MRALAVTTKFTHDGFGVAPLAVMISTVWPLRSTRAQRHQAPVDLGGDAAVADVGVHRVGEVDHGRAARQAQDLALAA